MNVLLIRGLARQARHWGDFAPVIEEHLEGAKAFALDLPGVGTENHRDSPIRMSQIVDDMRARWRALDAPEGPWLVFGVSLGGMVLLNWVTRYPNDFTHAVVANTSAANLGHPLERLTPKGLGKLLKSVVLQEELAREQNILTIISNEEGKRQQVAENWAKIAREDPMRRMLAVRQILAAGSYPAPRNVPIPTLVLACPNDRFVSSRCSERLAERIGAPIRRHPTAGHSITVDAPEWVAKTITEWVHAH